MNPDMLVDIDRHFGSANHNLIQEKSAESTTSWQRSGNEIQCFGYCRALPTPSPLSCYMNLLQDEYDCRRPMVATATCEAV